MDKKKREEGRKGSIGFNWILFIGMKINKTERRRKRRWKTRHEVIRCYRSSLYTLSKYIKMRKNGNN